MHRLFFVVLFLINTSVQAQDSLQTQWVSTIIEASSEQSPREYSAEQLIGKPNVTPGTGANPNAWMPFREDKEEYVKVGFEVPIRIRQIAIAESYNPRSDLSDLCIRQSDNEFLINTFEPGPIELESRLLHIFF
jgi:OOP family OmpA-OmpF porin